MFWGRMLGHLAPDGRATKPGFSVTPLLQAPLNRGSEPNEKDAHTLTMAEIQPFAATRYTSEYEPDLNRLLTPPYDVISSEMQSELYDRHPRNLVRIDYGRNELGDEKSGSDKYSRAAGNFSDWMKAGVLARDPHPAIYVYEQEFDLPGRGRRKRRGFLRRQAGGAPGRYPCPRAHV